MWQRLILTSLVLAGMHGIASPARAQQLDMTRGGPMEITATEGLEWHQNEQQVVARGDARVVRGNVTITADKMIAYYRKKSTSSAVPEQPREQRAAMPGMPGGGSNEIYRVEAIGRVHIYTATDNVWGGRAIYDMDQAVMLMTGGGLKLTTPNQTLTARDSLEYWTNRHMAVARGDAVVVTNDGKRLSADTLVAYTREAGAPRTGTPAGGKLQRVEAFGQVTIRTQAETVIGDRAVYVADTGKARLGGNVRITRGQNQLNGSDVEVDMNTGVSRLLAGGTGRVAGMIVPNDASNKTAPANEANHQRAPRPERRR